MLVKETPYSLTLYISKTCSTQNIKMVIIIIFFNVKCHIFLQFTQTPSMTKTHYNDVTMSSIASQITCVSIVFVQSFVQAQIKENTKAPRHWPLWGESIGHRWISPLKGAVLRKMFHMMTSSCWKFIRWNKAGENGPTRNWDVWALSTEQSYT